MIEREPNPREVDLLALRDRLREARAERGSCPPWDEVKSDFLPGGGSRDGREARREHVALCPYCAEHLKEWKQSLDYDADRLGAIEKGMAHGIVKGAQGLVRSFTRGKPLPAVEPEPEAEAPQRMYVPPVSEPENQAPPAAPPNLRLYVPPEPEPQPAAAPSPTGARFLVVEMADGRTPPESVYLCAQVLDAEVALVESVDELRGDPDLALVCGVILGGMRNSETWPDAVRHARRLVPRRPVVLLATYGVEPSAGARRALGEALQSESDPAERLLLALAPELR
jgi:hypothetical protein